MTRPGTSRSTSAVRPCGRSSKSRPGMKTSEEAETGGGAVTTTGGRVASSGRGAVSSFGGVSCVLGGGSWAAVAQGADRLASKARLVRTRMRHDHRAGVNICEKVIPHEHKAIQ